jgi:homoserine acetyltransferase
MKPVKSASLLALALGMALSTAPAQAQQLQLGEQFALRGYTGKAMGTALADVLRAESLGIVTNASSICASLTGAIAAQYLARTEAADPLRIAALASAADAAAAVTAMADRAAVALIFGGQTPAEENAALTLETLRALAAANYAGAVFLHVRVWAPGFAQKAAAADAAVAAYLAGKENIFAMTVDPNAGEVQLHRVSITPAEQKSVEVLTTVPMNEAWLGLLRRSI